MFDFNHLFNQLTAQVLFAAHGDNIAINNKPSSAHIDLLQQDEKINDETTQLLVIEKKKERRIASNHGFAPFHSMSC